MQQIFTSLKSSLVIKQLTLNLIQHPTFHHTFFYRWLIRRVQVLEIDCINDSCWQRVHTTLMDCGASDFINVQQLHLDRFVLNPYRSYAIYGNIMSRFSAVRHCHLICTGAHVHIVDLWKLLSLQWHQTLEQLTIVFDRMHLPLVDAEWFFAAIQKLPEKRFLKLQTMDLKLRNPQYHQLTRARDRQFHIHLFLTNVGFIMQEIRHCIKRINITMPPVLVYNIHTTLHNELNKENIILELYYYNA